MKKMVRMSSLVLYPGAEQCTTTTDCLKKKIFLIDDELNVLVKKSRPGKNC